MLIAGPTRCGKTNTLMHILREPLVYYDKLFIFTPNHHQEKMVNFSRLMDKISEKVGYEVLTMGNSEDILDTTEYPENMRNIVVFDDLVNASNEVQNRIANHYTDGRHHNVSPVYLSQSYYDVPQKLRLNCSHMILYPPVTKNHSKLIARENLIDPELFKKLNKYEFLFVDKENKTVKKNFDEEI